MRAVCLISFGAFKMLEAAVMLLMTLHQQGYLNISAVLKTQKKILIPDPFHPPLLTAHHERIQQENE